MASATSGFCPQCGTALAPNANFCRECGAVIPTDPDYSRPSTPVDDRPYSRVSNGIMVPGELAGMGRRTVALLASVVIVGVLNALPVIGVFLGTIAYFVNWYLYRRGQDIGARVTQLRIVTEEGDLAGFYTTYARGIAAVISAIALGAGFWTAYFDRDRRTWHDKMLGTYVVDENSWNGNLEASSGSGARIIFWVTLPLVLIGWVYPFL